MNRFVELSERILPLLRPYVKRIAVFGSFARGEDTPEGDIDLLVEQPVAPIEPRPLHHISVMHGFGDDVGSRALRDAVVHYL